jgi:glycosyltransferase involved in cell wall biosynthesis
MKKGLTVVMLTHNEKTTISRALLSVKDIADQIVLVDDCSEKSFLDICRKAAPNAEIYVRKLDDFSGQKNFGISKARHEWILNLDADEEVSPELANEIKNAVSQDDVHAAFKIMFATAYFERFLENSESHIRLFRNDGTVFAGSVHEGLKIKGHIECMKSPIMHHHWKGYDNWFEKLNKYAYMAAISDIRKGKNYSKIGILLRMLVVPVINFFDGFLIKRRFQLGFDGLVHSMSGGSNAIRRFAFYYEIKFKDPELFKKEFGSEKNGEESAK